MRCSTRRAAKDDEGVRGAGQFATGSSTVTRAREPESNGLLTSTGPPSQYLPAVSCVKKYAQTHTRSGAGEAGLRSSESVTLAFFDARSSVTNFVSKNTAVFTSAGGGGAGGAGATSGGAGGFGLAV